MNNMRKLMEAVQLNEYFVRPGDSFENILILNVFSDMTPGQKHSDMVEFDTEEEENDPLWKKWLQIEKKYSRITATLSKEIKKMRKRKLTDKEAEFIESLMYDGSDLYDNLEEMLALPQMVYDDQIKGVCKLLGLKVSALSEAPLDEAEDMLAVDPAVKAELGQDAQENVWSVWFGDSEGESGYVARGLSKEKALATLKLEIQQLLNDWSDEAYVVHTQGRNIWTIKDPRYQMYIHYELQKYDDEGMRDWSAG